jgi:hypothetical protein
MSNFAQKPGDSLDLDQEKKKGPNLILLYALLGLGLLAAMAFAAMIVWPFYLRR